MSDMLAVDMRLNAKNTVRTLAAGLHQLYKAAAEKWPGQECSRTTTVKDDIFTVELKPYG